MKKVSIALTMSNELDEFEVLGELSKYLEEKYRDRVLLKNIFRKRR